MGAGESENLFSQSWEEQLNDMPEYNYAVFE
jgi:hypothetical protein